MKTSDLVGGAIYGYAAVKTIGFFWPAIQLVLALCVLWLMIAVPFNCAYMAITGNPSLFSKSAELEGIQESDVWGYNVHHWVASGQFEKAAAIYAQPEDSIFIRHCRDGNWHDCQRMWADWRRQEELNRRGLK